VVLPSFEQGWRGGAQWHPVGSCTHVSSGLAHAPLHAGPESPHGVAQEHDPASSWKHAWPGVVHGPSHAGAEPPQLLHSQSVGLPGVVDLTHFSSAVRPQIPTSQRVDAA